MWFSFLIIFLFSNTINVVVLYDTVYYTYIICSRQTYFRVTSTVPKWNPNNVNPRSLARSLLNSENRPKFTSKVHTQKNVRLKFAKSNPDDTGTTSGHRLILKSRFPVGRSYMVRSPSTTDNAQTLCFPLLPAKPSVLFSGRK